MKGERITYSDLHPGIMEYVHSIKNWKPHYATINEMDYLDGMVYEMMLHSHDEAVEEAVARMGSLIAAAQGALNGR